MLLNQLLRSIVGGELSQLKKIEVMMKLSSVDPELLSLALVRLEGCVLWGFDQPATLQLNAILSRIIETEDSLLSSLYKPGGGGAPHHLLHQNMFRSSRTDDNNDNNSDDRECDINENDDMDDKLTAHNVQQSGEEQ